MTYEPFYDFRSRYILPGLIKNYEYDTILIGTSMSQNFRPSLINKLYNCKSINLSCPGASAYEQALIFRKASISRNIKRVLVGIDAFAYAGDKKRLRDPNFPMYLYDFTIKYYPKYFLNYEILAKTRKINFSSMFDGLKYQYDLDKVGDAKERNTYSREMVMAAYKNKNFRALHFKKTFLKNSKISFRYNLVSIIEDNPNIDFILFFPPISIIQWIIYAEEGALADQLQFKKNVTQALRGLKNVKLYDLQDVESITHNLDNYKDMSHYSPAINNKTLELIQGDKFLLSDENFIMRQKKLSRQIQEYIKNKLPQFKQDSLKFALIRSRPDSKVGFF
jgi:hypothetical protein